MLLPAKFQTPAPAALGAKITAMPAPPKPPHVHQWVAVPDSKIHSRCAECGTVTLTEIVAPKVVAFDMASGPDHTAYLAWARGAFDALCTTPPANKTGAEFRAKLKALDAELRAGEAAMKARASETLGTARQALRDFFAQGGARDHAVNVLASFGADRVGKLDPKDYGRFVEKLMWPSKHYTSITTPDGKVRMVETDAEGWIKNDGTQPVADDVRVDVQNNLGGHMTYDAKTFAWQNVSRWRPTA